MSNVGVRGQGLFGCMYKNMQNPQCEKEQKGADQQVKWLLYHLQSSAWIIFKNLRFDFERKSCKSTYRIGMFVSLQGNSLASIACRQWHVSLQAKVFFCFCITLHCISLQTVLIKCVQGINGQRAMRSRVAVQKIKIKAGLPFSFN